MIWRAYSMTCSRVSNSLSSSCADLRQTLRTSFAHRLHRFGAWVKSHFKRRYREEFRDTMGSMLEEVNRLNALVENLLTIARADAGRIQLHPTEFSPLDLAREAAGLFEVLIEERDQDITIAGDEAIRVKGDRVFLRQALVNVIHNAVKFSPAGGLISVDVQRQPAGGVRVNVADQGPGITPEHSQRVFDRFYRADESRSRESGGAGLGLSIAQWAVKVHGGTIGLVTKPGHGCTFRIDLPSAG